MPNALSGLQDVPSGGCLAAAQKQNTDTEERGALHKINTTAAETFQTIDMKPHEEGFRRYVFFTTLRIAAKNGKWKSLYPTFFTKNGINLPWHPIGNDFGGKDLFQAAWDHSHYLTALIIPLLFLLNYMLSIQIRPLWRTPPASPADPIGDPQL